MEVDVGDLAVPVCKINSQFGQPNAVVYAVELQVCLQHGSSCDCRVCTTKAIGVDHLGSWRIDCANV